MSYLPHCIEEGHYDEGPWWKGCGCFLIASILIVLALVLEG
jgi:hypothetical protein